MVFDSHYNVRFGVIFLTENDRGQQFVFATSEIGYGWEAEFNQGF